MIESESISSLYAITFAIHALQMKADVLLADQLDSYDAQLKQLYSFNARQMLNKNTKMKHTKTVIEQFNIVTVLFGVYLTGGGKEHLYQFCRHW